MKWLLVFFSLICLLFADAQTNSKPKKSSIENTGFECRNYKDNEAFMIILRSGEKACLGKARCWKKSKCPKNDPTCTAFYGREQLLFCNPEGGKCISPTKCANQKGTQSVVNLKRFTF